MSGITLAQASMMTVEPLKKGIIETIARESTVLETLPFINLNGNAYGFIREETTGGVGFRAVNEDYVHENPTHSNHVERLKMLGSMVEVDRFVELTQNLHDVRAEATASKAKAIANSFTDTFFNGDTSTNPLAFDGLNVRTVASQVVDSEGFQLHTGLIHQLMDMVQGGADVLYMNKQTRRKLTSLFMSQQTFVHAGQDAFGRAVQMFGDVRIAVVEDMFIEDNSIYAVKFGEDAGIVGIQAGDLTAVDNGLRGVTYETLIEWFVSIVDGNPKGMARLKNFTL